MPNLTELDAISRRVLGALLEKEQTTPDYYPLTLNALISACNQTTSRDPVMSLERYEVLRALHALEKEKLVERVTGPRVDRWSHLLFGPLYSPPTHKALLTLLLLRGAQTIGELKGRSERMHSFESLGEIAQTLESLAAAEPPLVRELTRRPGQKDSRWVLNISEEIPEVKTQVLPEVTPFAGPLPQSLESRVERLEKLVAQILESLGPD